MQWQTFALAAGIALAAPLDSYFQLTIGLMILVVGFALLSVAIPYQRAWTQATQVMLPFTCSLQ